MDGRTEFNGEKTRQKKQKMRSVVWSSDWRAYFIYYTMGLCWMLDSDWLTNVSNPKFQAGLDCISVLYHFAKWFQLFQRSFQPLKENEPQNPTKTLTKQIHIFKKMIFHVHFHVFLMKFHGFHYLWKPCSLSLCHKCTHSIATQTETFTHRNFLSELPCNFINNIVLHLQN